MATKCYMLYATCDRKNGNQMLAVIARVTARQLKSNSKAVVLVIGMIIGTRPHTGMMLYVICYMLYVIGTRPHTGRMLYVICYMLLAQGRTRVGCRM